MLRYDFYAIVPTHFYDPISAYMTMSEGIDEIIKSNTPNEIPFFDCTGVSCSSGSDGDCDYCFLGGDGCLICSYGERLVSIAIISNRIVEAVMNKRGWNNASKQ